MIQTEVFKEQYTDIPSIYRYTVCRAAWKQSYTIAHTLWQFINSDINQMSNYTTYKIYILHVCVLCSIWLIVYNGTMYSLIKLKLRVKWGW